MNVLIKHAVLLTFGFTSALTGLPDTAIANMDLGNAVWTTEDAQNDYLSLLHKTGMRAGSKSIPSDFFADENVRRIFTRNLDLRQNMPPVLPSSFQPIISEIEDYIERQALSKAEDVNEVTHGELAEKMVRASFCFGTDPKMAAAKIRMESVFVQNAVSPTGAVGLSQLTGIAIEEVNDQLGNRGNAQAPSANTTYFRKAIRCYLGKDLRYPWTVGVVTAGRKMSKDDIKRSKVWIQRDVDRDLIYGHILLKVFLAVTKSQSSGIMDNYADAFVRYNGDNAKVKNTRRKYVYSKGVMNYFKNINYEPSRDAELTQPTTPEEKENLKVWGDVYEI